MPHAIAFRNQGTDEHNAYEVVFESDTRPEQSDAMGASINRNDGVTERNGVYVASGAIGPGTDAYEYVGSRGEMRFDRPGDVQVNVNGQGWSDSSNFARLVKRGGGSPDDGDDGGSSPSPDSGQTRVPTSDFVVKVGNESPGLGCVSRPLASAGDIEIHVGRGRDFESLQQAFNAIPFLLMHNAEIVVHGRTRDGNTAHIHSVSMANHVDLHVVGVGNAVINNGGVNVGVDGKLDHIEFRNLKFEFISQCKDARFVNCVFRGRGNSAFSGKMGAKMLINCVVGDGSNDYAIRSIGGEMVEIRDCELNAQDVAVRGTGISMHSFTGDNTINAPEKYDGYADAVYSSGLLLG